MNHILRVVSLMDYEAPFEHGYFLAEQLEQAMECAKSHMNNHSTVALELVPLGAREHSSREHDNRTLWEHNPYECRCDFCEAAKKAEREREEAWEHRHISLAGCNGGPRIPVIKAVRWLLGIGLKEAKELVDEGATIQIPEGREAERRELEQCIAECKLAIERADLCCNVCGKPNPFMAPELAGEQCRERGCQGRMYRRA